jgi:hypothetical protein
MTNIDYHIPLLSCTKLWIILIERKEIWPFSSISFSKNYNIVQLPFLSIWYTLNLWLKVVI